MLVHARHSERREAPGLELSALPPGHQYAGGCGNRATRRYLEQRWKQALRLKDEASVEARTRLLAAVAGEPEAERIAMQISLVAMLAVDRLRSSGHRFTWAEALHQALDEIGKTDKGVAAYRTPRFWDVFPWWSVPGLACRALWRRMRRWVA